MIRFLLPLVLLLVGLAGCAVRLTDAQAVQLSQARANVFAARLTSDQDARAALFSAVGARVLAGLADIDLPAPGTPVAALVAPDGAPFGTAVAQEVQAADAAEKAPPSGWLGTAAAVAGGVGLAALSVLRLSPGAFGMLANLGYTFLAPKATRDMRAVQGKAVEVAEQAVAYGHAVTQAATAAGLGPEVEALKERAAVLQERIGVRGELGTLLARAKSAPSPLTAPA